MTVSPSTPTPVHPAGESPLRLAASGALAGGIAAVAYLAEMYADMAILGHRYDEVRVIGRAITRGPAWRPLGIAGNLLAGAAAGAFYAAVVEPRLPGSPIVKGLIFAQVENATLYPPVMPLLDRFHPDIRQGSLPRSFTPLSFLEAILRHVAYGAALGWLAPRARRWIGG